MIKVMNQIKIYEVNGNETALSQPVAMTISSHWLKEGFVVLQVAGSPDTYTVSVGDLQAAIANAGNSNQRG